MANNETSVIDGVSIAETPISGGYGKVTYVRVLDERGEKLIGRTKGQYITIESETFKTGDRDAHEAVAYELAHVLKEIIPNEGTALVAGLGNAGVAADCLGVKTISKIFVTNHIVDAFPDKSVNLRRVTAISPNVMGATGMETCDIIKGVCAQTKPSFVICVDALAARAVRRLNTTIQIGDTGLTPGGGMGVAHKTINEDYLGIPVISIGVPTIVDTATIVNDTFDMALDCMTREMPKGARFNGMLKNLQEREKYTLFKRMLDIDNGNTFVAPKDVNEVMERLSGIIADGINIALQPDIALDDLKAFMY